MITATSRTPHNCSSVRYNQGVSGTEIVVAERLDVAVRDPRLPGRDIRDLWLSHLAPNTGSAYARDLAGWEDYLDAHQLAWTQATPPHVTDWVAGLRESGLSEITINRKLAALSSFYKWCAEQGAAVNNPAGPVRRKKVNVDPVDRIGLNAKQVKAVYAAAKHYGPRSEAFVALLAVCGFRVSEVLNASVEDYKEISGGRALRVVGKGNKPRTVPIPPSVVAILDTYLNDRVAGPLFTLLRSDKPWKRKEAHEHLRAVGHRALGEGFNLHPHLLRHTAASLALRAGGSLDQVQDMLGHASPVTTKLYVKAHAAIENSPVFATAAMLDLGTEES